MYKLKEDIIVYISHFLEEGLTISNRVSLLRNGKLIRTNFAKDETKKSLINVSNYMYSYTRTLKKKQTK